MHDRDRGRQPEASLPTDLADLVPRGLRRAVAERDRGSCRRTADRGGREATGSESPPQGRHRRQGSPPPEHDRHPPAQPREALAPAHSSERTFVLFRPISTTRSSLARAFFRNHPDAPAITITGGNAPPLS
ncbi:hypothetical protein ACFPRL_23600 [Pseudoclavibacter helvolus]